MYDSCPFLVKKKKNTPKQSYFDFIQWINKNNAIQPPQTTQVMGH